MIKHEIKVEISKSEELEKIIEKAYFEDGLVGKILGKKHYMVIDDSDEINYTIFKGLDGATVKVTNEDVIDGSMRFMVDETEGEVRLYPISIYCIKEDRYSFY
jgi:hypothetical protein